MLKKQGEMEIGGSYRGGGEGVGLLSAYKFCYQVDWPITGKAYNRDFTVLEAQSSGYLIFRSSVAVIQRICLA